LFVSILFSIEFAARTAAIFEYRIPFHVNEPKLAYIALFNTYMVQIEMFRNLQSMLGMAYIERLEYILLFFIVKIYVWTQLYSETFFYKLGIFDYIVMSTDVLLFLVIMKYMRHILRKILWKYFKLLGANKDLRNPYLVSEFFNFR
ncbi:hypothetical protein TCON_2829, partial [Astathelohania contejeani]